MSKINFSKVLIGGLVAGLLINLGEFLTHGVYLKEAWAQLAQAGQTMDPGSKMGWVFASRFAIGLLFAWCYAAVRPRLGASPQTALKVGVVGSLLVWGPMSVDMAVFAPHPASIALASFIGGVISGIVGAYAAAWLYSE